MLEKRKRVRQRKLREEKKLTRRCEQEEEKERSKCKHINKNRDVFQFIHIGLFLKKDEESNFVKGMV